MESYGGTRGNGKFSSSKNHSKTFRSVRSHDDEIYPERERNDDRNEYGAKKSKKPEQFYLSSQHQRSFDNRQSRQGSEPARTAPTGNYSNQESIKNSYGNSDRSRDTRSSEPGIHYSEARNPKPPSGPHHRTSNSAFQRLPPNIDTLPPRLKKKYLLEAGLPENFGEKPIMEMTQQSYSHTLPGSGRGRSNRYDQQSFHQHKYNNSYQPKYNNQNQAYQRSLTPPAVKSSHLDRPKLQQKQQLKPATLRYEWKASDDIQRDSSPIKTIEDSNFDWNIEVMNSQSLPPEINASKTVSHNKHDDNSRNRQRRRRNRSASSNGSVERSGFNQNENFQNNFKMPFPKTSNQNRQRRNSQSSYNSRENSTERGYSYGSRENSLDRRQIRRNRYNGRRGSDYQSSRENSTERFGNSWSRNDSLNNLKDDDPQSWRQNEGLNMSSKTDQKIAELTKEFKNSVELNQRTLFDPNNPSKPIVITSAQNRLRDCFPDCNDNSNDQQQYLSSVKPVWFKKSSEQYKAFKNKHLIDELDRLDHELMSTIDNSDLLRVWDHCQQLRQRVQYIFIELLDKEMRFCQQVHVEHYFWKLLFYRVIEVLRKNLQECDESLRSSYKEKALETVDGGTRYLESLLKKLETSYNFSLEDFIGDNAASFKSGLGSLALALVSAQKIFLFLGDLARYREQINQTNNFGRAKNFYTKAQQVVPKNGKPFNQLALLAVYSKRKIDAVYFYMRSLMSVSPFNPARESLVALFDEIRKKYEFSQRKREEKNRSRLKEKEHRFDGNLRKETWIHPEGGSRVHRTAPLDPSLAGRDTDSSEDEELHSLDAAELNKRFVISFLHVQGKLITRIGMESFHTCAIQMLKEFRALLQISPITINSHRLLQLISLNMYSIACTELKDPNISKLKARSEVQECAIAVGLLMFGIILERFIEVLKASISDSPRAPISSEARDSLDNGGNSSKSNHELPKKILTLNEDSKVMLPSIKVWCDWMMFHVKVWNPPPFCSEYKIGAVSNHDPWNGLATLMTLLETIVDTNKDYLSLQREKDCVMVRLQEDVTLAGFTPLKNNTPDPIFCRCDIDIEIAQNALRLQKLIFFGTDFLCKYDQPILTKVCPSHAGGKVEYKSVVQNRTESSSESEILLESFSDGEDDAKKDTSESNGSVGKTSVSPDLKTHNEIAEIRRLLRRKDELERKQKMEEKYNERLQDILSQSTVALHIEVHPRLLVPDTNCFVDDLMSIQAIASAHPLYQLMIPITVINELEGLCRGVKPLTSTGIDVSPVQLPSALNSRAGSRNNPNHAAFVAQASKDALVFLKAKTASVKFVTTQGNFLMSATFTSEEQSREQKSNDDKILDTALNLCKKNVEEKKGKIRHLVREVVLLTNDRNLRVKALTKDIPVRELQDFIKWAGLGPVV